MGSWEAGVLALQRFGAGVSASNLLLAILLKDSHYALERSGTLPLASVAPSNVIVFPDHSVVFWVPGKPGAPSHPVCCQRLRTFRFGANVAYWQHYSISVVEDAIKLEYDELWPS